VSREVSDFPTGSELELELGDGPRFYRLMHKFKNDGGGWCREVDADGRLDERRDGIRILSGSLPVLSSRRVPAK
jgi:hypothetical protein